MFNLMNLLIIKRRDVLVVELEVLVVQLPISPNPCQGNILKTSNFFLAYLCKI